jgi:predicted dehydrogenase
MLKFGIIGAGAISQSGYDGVTMSGEAEVVAIADISEKRRKDFAARNKVPRQFPDAASLTREKDLDAVYIAVPNAFHAPFAIAALEAGKHVILDKPFATSWAEAKTVIDAAVKAKKLFMVGMNQRFTPGAQRVRALADKGFFGDVYRLRAFWRRRAGSPRLGTWFGNRKLAGGGCFLDIGVHMLDLAMWTSNNFEVESVSGAVTTVFGNRGLGQGGWGLSDPEGLPFDVDDGALAFIRMKNGAIIQVEISWAAHQKDDDAYNVELFGSEAGALVYPGEIYYHDKALNAPANVAELGTPLTYPAANRFVNFVKAIRGEEKPCVSHEESLKVQRVIDAVYESSATRKEVRL